VRVLAYLLVVSLGAVFGYGFWYAQTHAWLDMDLDDEQGKHIRNAQLSFYDETGQLLAEGKTDNEEVGIVYLRHPVRGYCGPTPQDQNAGMRECLKEHSEWQAKWLPRASRVTIRFGPCELIHVPLTLRTSAVWGLWWVPLPHVGGLESTRYAGTLKINRSQCTTP
jgi:hypothetical protein